VSDHVHADRHRDRAGERDEEPAERIDVQLHARQWQQPSDVHRPYRAEHAGQPRPYPDGADARRENARDHTETVVAQFVCHGHGRDRQCGGHLPVTDRKAATISAGVGGQPGTSTSTGTTSLTAPTTPYASLNTPRFSAQSPQAITTRGC